MRSVACLACALLFTTGCFDVDDDFESPPEAPEWTAPEPLERGEGVHEFEDPEPAPRPDPIKALHCVKSANELRAIQRVRQVAEASVHELVTCGGAQLQLSSSFVARILLSNDQFFDPETIDLIDSALGFSSLPFEHREDGRWRMGINDDSFFDLTFRLPGSEVVSTANIFDLASYIEGAEVTTTLSFREMLDDFDAVNTYIISWKGYGPLADLMFPEGRPEWRVFGVRASLWDLANLAMGWTDDLPDFGPLENLPALEVESNVELKDARDGVTVEYTFGAMRQSLGHFHTEQQVAFELRSLAAEGEGVVLQGEAADLRVLGRGTLAGPLVYAVDGIAVDGVRIVDDFGDGAGYPEESYWCPEDWPKSPYADAMEPELSE